MIVPMSKITVLTLASGQTSALNILQKAGVLHLHPFQPPTGESLEAARKQLERIRRVQTVLTRIGRESALANATSTTPLHASSPSPNALIEETERLLNAIQESQNRRHALNEQIRLLRPFGNFDPSLARELESHGIILRLFKSPSRAHLTLPEGIIQIPLSSDGRYDYFALLASEEPTCQGASAVPLPDRSLGSLIRDAEEADATAQNSRNRLMALSVYRTVLKPLEAEAEEKLTWEEARAGMAGRGPVVLLQGYAPEECVASLRQLSARHGWGLLSEAPGPDDLPPTLIRNPPWIRPVQAVFKLIGILPGYRETDVSPVFLLFFTLFVAMLIGDAVYGLLFLGLTFFLKWRRFRLPEHVLPLLGILSIATLLWGVLSGNYLGIEKLPPPLARLKLPLLADPVALQSFCFLVGAIHLSIAHGWNALRLLPSPQAIAHLGWIGLCAAMYALANFLVLAVPLPPGFFALLAVSVFYIFFFTVPLDRFRTEAVSLVTLPLSLIGNFGDVVSYLRLYLVGSASIVLIKAVNGILFGTGPLGWAGMIAAGIVLFFVHMLNLMLASLAVLVHGVRLNALEFSTHMGIQWLGRPYTPFRKEVDEQSPKPLNP